MRTEVTKDRSGCTPMTPHQFCFGLLFTSCTQSVQIQSTAVLAVCKLNISKLVIMTRQKTNKNIQENGLISVPECT